MKNPTFSLLIKFQGEGFNCSNCGRMRPTTKYQIRCQELVVAQFNLCDTCQDKGYEVKFTPRSEVNDRRWTDDHERQERLVRKRQVVLSRKFETGVAAQIGGRRQPGSGNTSHAKADVRKMDRWRLEHKYTDSVSGYRLLVADLAAVVSHANLVGEWPGLIVAFRKLKRDFVVIPYELFLWVVEILDADPTLTRRSAAAKHKPTSPESKPPG